MVPKSENVMMAHAVLLRICLFTAVLVIGFYEVTWFESFLRDTLHFKETCSGFCALQGIGTGVLALILSYSFWIGVVFGTLGKKTDYILIGILAILALLSFYNLSLQIYMGLIEVILAGNAIGFGLKLLRMRVFKK
jgi:hypothetical protein